MTQTSLETIRQQLGNTADCLGMPIDEGIFETVVVLNAMGLRTTQSCQGHPGQHGHPYPWVEIAPAEPERGEWYDDERVSEQVQNQLTGYYARAIELLTQFYSTHTVSYDVMLAFSRMGWSFRLQSIGSFSMERLNQSDQMSKFDEYTKEMLAFTDFLASLIKRDEK